MVSLDVFNQPKWPILTNLVNRALSPSELAKLMKSSLSNMSQQLKLLEAMGFVKAEYEHSQKPGKPHKKYSVNKNHLFLGIINKRHAIQETLTLNATEQALLTLFLLPDTKTCTSLTKFFLTKEYFFNYTKSIAVLHRKSTEIQLLILAEDVEHIRKHYSHEIITHNGTEKKVVIWSHTPEEFAQGLQKREEYFLNLAKNYLLIYDPQDTARTIMERYS